MSTYMPKAADISRNWYVLDADGKTLGSVAAEALNISSTLPGMSRMKQSASLL